MAISGIYQIKNTTNNKIYVGSSCDIHTRWKCHKNDLRRNKHHSSHLQNAWNKYGECNFIFKILEIVDVSFLIEFEQKYMDKFESFERKNGYNIYRFVQGRRSSVVTKETKNKISESLKNYFEKHPLCKKARELRRKNTIGENNPFYGKSHTIETKKRMSESRIGKNTGVDSYAKKEILQYDINGLFVKEWFSITEASVKLGINRRGICNNLNDLSKSSGGFVWVYKNKKRKREK